MSLLKYLISTRNALHFNDQVSIHNMSPQKLFCYHLPTRGRVGVKLGDADTSQTYL